MDDQLKTMDDQLKRNLEAAKARMPAAIRDAHKHSSAHVDEIKRSELCGCFYCLKTYPPSAINDWTDGDTTALCPRCSVDSVIGSAAGIELTNEFLKTMKSYWF